MDNRLIYFAKVNLNSSIFEVYEKKFSMDEVFAAIMQQVNEDEIFIKHDNYTALYNFYVASVVTETSLHKA